MTRHLLKSAVAIVCLASSLGAWADNAALDAEIRAQGREALVAMQADALGQLDGRGQALTVLSEALEQAPAPAVARADVPCPPASPSPRSVSDLLPDLPRLPTVRAPLILRVH